MKEASLSCCPILSLFKEGDARDQHEPHALHSGGVKKKGRHCILFFLSRNAAHLLLILVAYMFILMPEREQKSPESRT